MKKAGARVLVVDDEPAIRRALQTNLSGHGFQVETAATGDQALVAFSKRRPDIILLDLGLPDMDGSTIIRTIRQTSSIPIVVLSVRSAEREKVAALDLGADDYLSKPFGVGELLARIRASLRHVARPPAGSAPLFRTGNLLVDLERRQVLVGDKEVHLSPTEYDLLKVLITHPNKVVTDRALLLQVWGPQYSSEGHYLHVYVARLRKKLEADPQNPRILITEGGIGYRLLVDER